MVLIEHYVLQRFQKGLMFYTDISYSSVKVLRYMIPPTIIITEQSDCKQIF